MVNSDYGFRLTELQCKVRTLENELAQLKGQNSDSEDWDNAKLMLEWGICKRSAANYRKNGLNYYKRGGRIFYSAKHRAEFLKNKEV